MSKPIWCWECVETEKRDVKWRGRASALVALLAGRRIPGLRAADPQACGRLAATLCLQRQQALQAHARPLQRGDQLIEAQLDRDGGVGGLDGGQVDCGVGVGKVCVGCEPGRAPGLLRSPASALRCWRAPPSTPPQQAAIKEAHQRSPAPPGCRSASPPASRGRRCSARMPARQGRRPP